MPLIITPGQLARRADLYHQLGQLIAAGISLTQALQQAHRHPPAAADREPIRQLLEAISEGCTFSEAVRRPRGWLPEFDITLLEAGERSGRLDTCFHALEQYYSDRARLMKQMIGNLLYPVGLLHFAVLIFAFVRFVSGGDLLLCLVQMAAILVPIYIIVAVIIVAMQNKHGETWRGWVERVLHPIPLLGSARRELALARLAMALEALLNAGVTVIEAWDLAATVSGSPGLRRAVIAWRPSVVGGETPSEALNASGKFPSLFASQYASGEISGKLDEVLRRLAKYYREEGTRKIQTLAQLTPQAIYILIALAIAYQVVAFWMGIYGPNSPLSNILNGR